MNSFPAVKATKVAVDNFFSSLDLTAEFSKRGIGFVGTLRSNRLKDCWLKSENELKKEGCGAFDYAVDSLRNIAIVRWYDNRSVTLVSNCVHGTCEYCAEMGKKRRKAHRRPTTEGCCDVY